MRIKNLSSGERSIAATDDTVPPGGTVDVPAEVAKALLEQEDVWGKPTTKSTKNDSEDD